MNDQDRRRDHLRALVGEEPAREDDLAPPLDWLQRLCRSATRQLVATGVGVSVLSAQGRTMSATSSAATARLEDLQVTLGEGPTLEAYEVRRPVLVPDLDDARSSHWPTFAAEARQRGLRAVFAFPLHVGAATLGGLGVYRDRPGMLSPEARTDALVYADLARDGLLDAQDHGLVAERPAALADLDGSQFDVYQAQGMVMVQLGVSLTEAMARLRAHAFAQERDLADVARDVVARRLAFDRDQP